MLPTPAPTRHPPVHPALHSVFHPAFHPAFHPTPAPIRHHAAFPRPAGSLRAGLLLALAGLLAGCVGVRPAPLPMPTPAQTTPSQRPVPATFQTVPSRAEAFLAALRPYCGQAFAGRVVADIPSPTPPSAAARPATDPFAGKALVMHVRECGADVVRIPFHVGADRSRTWVLSRMPGGGLQLKHDHRHADGTPDAVTMYGGHTLAEPAGAPARAGETRRAPEGGAASVRAAGTVPLRLEFPVDDDSIAMFGANGLAASVRNVWAMDLLPGQRFVYELARPDGRLFRVEFDLRRPVPPPPAPWGG